MKIHAQVVHEDGRKCTLIDSPDGAHRVWVFRWDDDVPLVCAKDHPKAERPEPEDSRGEFGMPGIGVGKLFMVDPPVKTCTEDEHVPMCGHQITIDQKGVWIPNPGHFAVGGFKMTVTEHGIDIDYGELGHTLEAVTPEAREALKALPSIIGDFLVNNAKYARAQSGHDLGLKGIIPDINRKTSALISRVWDDGHAGRDSTEELIGDLVGHLLLMIGKMKKEGHE